MTELSMFEQQYGSSQGKAEAAKITGGGWRRRVEDVDFVALGLFDHVLLTQNSPFPVSFY